MKLTEPKFTQVLNSRALSSPSVSEPPLTITSPTAVVHLEYDLESLPAPSNGWTRFVCISDTHTRSFPVPPGDVLLHSGDLTNKGTYREFELTMKWLRGLPHKIKIIIAGNHDLPLHHDYYEASKDDWHHKKQDTSAIMKLFKGEAAVKAGIVYLQDERYDFQTKDGGRSWSVYGSPWSPYFFGWAFNYHRGEEADALVSKFPKTDILLTHGPPSGILDETRVKGKAGCTSLTTRLPSLRPRIHVFGHIHESHGAEIRAWDPHYTPPEPHAHPAATHSENDESTQVRKMGWDNYEPCELQGTMENSETTEGLERTVFVNAANWPSGPRAMRGGRRVEFGGRGFQPVIVDLKDDS